MELFMGFFKPELSPVERFESALKESRRRGRSWPLGLTQPKRC